MASNADLSSNPMYNCYFKTPAAGTAVFWVIGLIVAVVVAGLIYVFVIKKKEDSAEGGEIDMYTRFIDQETASY